MQALITATMTRVPPIVPQTRFGDAVLSLGYLNSTANQNWDRGTFITSGTFIWDSRVCTYEYVWFYGFYFSNFNQIKHLTFLGVSFHTAGIDAGHDPMPLISKTTWKPLEKSKTQGAFTRQIIDDSTRLYKLRSVKVEIPQNDKACSSQHFYESHF